MSETSITNVMAEVFSAPLAAVVKAEAQYRRIWADWMASQLALVTEADGKTLRPDVQLSEILKTAPAVNLDGEIELAITMRVAGVREVSGGLGVGLSLGPVYGSGNFGFMSRKTEESVFSVQAKFTLSNTGRDLTGLLAQMQIKAADPAEVANAITELGKYMAPPKIDAGKGVVKDQ